MNYPFFRPSALNTKLLSKYIDGINERRQFTNNGPLVQELTGKLEDYLGVKNLLLVANGTLALQVAYKALSCEGDIYTTPLSFVATSSAFKWLGKRLTFSDIEEKSLNLDPCYLEDKFKDQILDRDVIVATHLYGVACNTSGFESIQKNSGVKLLYDASHALVTQVNNKSVLLQGDASALSLHATKILHTVEGGAIVFKNSDALLRAQKIINFGFDTESEVNQIGINAKMSELHAAVGLCALSSLDDWVDQRLSLKRAYKNALQHEKIEFIEGKLTEFTSPSYMAIILESVYVRNYLYDFLLNQGVGSKKYFESLLNQNPLFADHNSFLPVATAYKDRVLCLPLYPGLTSNDVKKISEVVLCALEKVILGPAQFMVSTNA